MGLLKHVEMFNIQKKKGIGGKRQWWDDCLIFPSSSLSFCRRERNRAPGVRGTTAHSLSPMPGTMSEFFLLLPDLGLLFPLLRPVSDHPVQAVWCGGWSQSEAGVG